MTANDWEQRHPIKMTPGKTYVIDLTSMQFDSYLLLEDDMGKMLAENDDISPNNQNSRIIFTPCPLPAERGKASRYRIVTTSFEQRGTGAYTFAIREFAAKKP